MCLDLLVPVWAESGYGILLDDGRRYTHAVWADNVWLFAHSYTEIQKMASSLTQVLAQYWLFWKPSSLEVMSGEA